MINIIIVLSRRSPRRKPYKVQKRTPTMTGSFTRCWEQIALDPFRVRPRPVKMPIVIEFYMYIISNSAICRFTGMELLIDRPSRGVLWFSVEMTRDFKTRGTLPDNGVITLYEITKGYESFVLLSSIRSWETNRCFLNFLAPSITHNKNFNLEI